MKRFILVVLALTLAFPVFAAQPTKLVFMLFGDKPAGMDAVVAEFEKRTRDTLNVKIEIVWTPLSDFFNKVKLKMAAGEQMDVVFDAPWANLVQASNQGLYQDIGSYFLNDAYPGLKKAYDARYIANNKFNGKVIAIPFTQGYKEIYGYFIRKDLRLKYGLPPLAGMKDYEVYLEKVKANNPDLIPLADDGNALRWVYGLNDELDLVRAKRNQFSVQLTGGCMAGIELTPDHKRVVEVSFAGDRPTPEKDIPFSTIDISQRWKNKGFFEPDLLTQQNATGLFKVGKAASVAHGISQFSALENELKKVVPSAAIEFLIASDSQRAFTPAAMKTDFKAFNFACIPASSKNTELVMKFFDWIFADQSNHDLWELGIEGKDWIADGPKFYKFPASGPNYLFPGYQLTWNPTMIRNLSGLDPVVYKILDYEMDIKSYYQTPLGGFQFDSKPVKTELAKVQNVLDQIGQVLGSAVNDDTLKQAYQLNQKARKLGLDKIRAEALKQVTDYLAKQKP